MILTGESPNKSSVEYTGEGKIAKKYFKPDRSWKYIQWILKICDICNECGADFVTVFQETYNSDKYKTLHLGWKKENIPIPSQCSGTRDHGWNERCRICCSPLGLDDFRKMHWQQECMHIFTEKNIHMQKSHFHVQITSDH